MIFLVGFPRSGTTYLQSLIATQDNIQSFPETHFFSTVTSGLLLPNLQVNKFELEEIEKRLKELMLFSYSKTICNYNTNLAITSKLHLRDLFLSTLRDYAQQNNQYLERKILLEKTPDHARNLDKIISCFPEAKIIAIIRSPLEAIHSFYTKLTKWRQPYPTLVEQWLETAESIEDFKQKNPQQIKIIRFEDLIKQPEIKVEEICQFIDVSFSASKLASYTKKAKEFMLPYEIWKQNNTNKNFTHPNSIIPLFKKLQMQFLLEDKMVKYGYKIHNKHTQRLYNTYRYLRNQLDSSSKIR